MQIIDTWRGTNERSNTWKVYSTKGEVLRAEQKSWLEWLRGFPPKSKPNGIIILLIPVINCIPRSFNINTRSLYSWFLCRFDYYSGTGELVLVLWVFYWWTFSQSVRRYLTNERKIRIRAFLSSISIWSSNSQGSRSNIPLGTISPDDYDDDAMVHIRRGRIKMLVLDSSVCEQQAKRFKLTRFISWQFSIS